MTTATQRGEIRKRRRHRAERRAATTPQREAHNDMMRRSGHLGWVHPRFDNRDLLRRLFGDDYDTFVGQEEED